MTRFMKEKCICAVCGTESTYNTLASTSVFGSPDLDLRPSEMKRSTMGTWIQECPECGYISSEVSDPTNVTRMWLMSAKYRTCNGNTFSSALAERFYKYYMINMYDDKIEDAFFAILHAAWACDDMEDNNKARYCREIAISLATQMIEEDHPNKSTFLLMRADLMRRSTHFEELIETYSSLTFEDKLLDQILAFEIEKAKNRDASCYRVKDAEGKIGK